MLAAQRLGVAAKDCLVIEDATVGVEAARRAEMKCVAVCTTHPREDLGAADLVVERLDYLTAEDIERLLSR